jgi:hypothetical protein
MDYWAAKNILKPAAEAKGYALVSSLDPDNASLASPRLIESFHNYLQKSMSELLDAGYQLTMNETRMNVYVNTTEAHALQNSTLSISLSSLSITPSEGVIVEGTLTPGRPDSNISVWYMNMTGSHSWSLLATVNTNSSSQYSYNWAAINAGNYSLKAVGWVTLTLIQLKRLQ